MISHNFYAHFYNHSYLLDIFHSYFNSHCHFYFYSHSPFYFPSLFYFSGDLRTTDSIEELAQSLHLDQVPKSWALKSYPSLRPLGSWLNDLQCRIQQLSDWISCPGEVLFVTWISGLFNPQSFLTGTSISLLAVVLT